LIERAIGLTDIPLNKILGALDRKDMKFWDQCTPEQQKKIAPFLLNRYMSIVKGNKDLHAYYLMATNQRVNVNYFALSKHPKLVWQLLCTVSPGMGNQFHQWIGNKKKNNNNSDIRKQLAALYPNYKEDELDLLASITSAQELKELAEASGA
jgi:hypothetical protein